MRLGHASKIDAWLTKMSTKMQPYSRFRYHTRDLGLWFLESSIVSLRGPFRYSWIRVFASRFSSDTRQHLNSMYLIEFLYLGLQEIKI